MLHLILSCSQPIVLAMLIREGLPVADRFNGSVVIVYVRIFQRESASIWDVAQISAGPDSDGVVLD